ncbi:MAG: hypothetical protein Q9160_002379 [Pyrenula sp. 1 TL-2023]
MATSRTPMNWQDYEYGRSNSQGSLASHSGQPDGKRTSPSSTTPFKGVPGNPSTGPEQDLRRRRSSISMRINSIRQIGGVNSIDNFARSWQRAAGFHEITPVRRSSVALPEPDDGDQHRESRDEEEADAIAPTRSLLREQIQKYGRPSDAVIDDGGEQSAVGQGRDTEADIFSFAPHLASPLAHSYGTSYGTLSSRISETARGHAAKLYQEQQLQGGQAGDKDREPLLVRQVEREDGSKTNVVIGQSTLPQTVFNSVNVLIGVGLLSLPLGIKYAGWLIGLLFLVFSAVVTRYTARLLAICLDAEPTLVTYADVAYVSFGHKARLVTSLLFSLELVAACVALVVLFADSLDALVPGYGVMQWKLLCALILVPLNFLPLRLLSISSILGIFCCTACKSHHQSGQQSN